MKNTQREATPVQSEIEIPIELAFGVIKVSKDLWAVKIIKYKGPQILETRIGNGTSMGHAITEAEDLVANFNLYSGIEFTAESYFNTVRII